MLFSILQFYYTVKPKILGKLFKLLFSNKNLQIGRNFKCDTFPKTLINNGSSVIIGDNVVFRRNVELRSHNGAKIKLGSNCRIDRGVRLLSNNNSILHIENGARIGLYSVFNGGDSIYVGRNTLVSGFVYLQTSMHNYKGDGDIKNQGYSHAPITIGQDNWLGTHVVIFPGVILGEKSIVGSSSVVNNSFEKNSIIAGIPAKLIKRRD